MTDLTSLWVALQKSKKWWGSAIIGILLFTAGFQVGKITSPYYTSHPIIFQESDGSISAPQNSDQSRGELAALKEEGLQQKVAGEKKIASQAAPSPSPLQGEGGGEVISQKKFVGSINSNLYHLPDCPSASRIKEENQIWFASEEEAKAQGYSPSKCTQDQLGQ